MSLIGDFERERCYLDANSADFCKSKKGDRSLVMAAISSVSAFRRRNLSQNTRAGSTRCVCKLARDFRVKFASDTGDSARFLLLSVVTGMFKCLINYVVPKVLFNSFYVRKYVRISMSSIFNGQVEKQSEY